MGPDTTRPPATGPEALGRREGRLVTLACVADAITGDRIVAEVRAALESGDLTVDEILEAVLHYAVYCGWPRASNLEMHVRRARAEIDAARGSTPTPFPARPDDASELGPGDWPTRIAGGAAEFADVNLIPAPPGDTPYQHAGILGFVFGHVWQRPGLPRRDRRFLTVACVGLAGAPVPIAAHVGAALASGEITPAEMDAVVVRFRAEVPDARAEALAAAVVAARSG